MKKIFITLLAFCFTFNMAFAQETTNTFAKGDNVLGIGFGIGGVYGFSKYSSQSPVFGLQYDRGIIELGMGGVIGVGGFIGYKSIVHKYSYYNGDYKDKWSIVVIGARGTFHYDLFKVDKLDTYAGTMIAFHAVSHKHDYPDNAFDVSSSHSSAAYASLFAGAKYYFAPSVAGYAEVGYGVSWLTAGIAFKF
jgi:hypothetical protein